ncbi:hypothetical protein ACFV1W_39605 [Kitasatospora sp. NPDC059648]|uniref:hypothetical protein n=1 Tax=Kitasatospora sp. NPDC059648 TaxID=3346894 RepID=UPI0036A64831
MTTHAYTGEQMLSDAITHALAQHGITPEYWTASSALCWLVIPTADGGEIGIEDGDSDVEVRLSDYRGMRALYTPARDETGGSYETAIYSSPRLYHREGGAERFTAELQTMLTAITACIAAAQARHRWTLRYGAVPAPSSGWTPAIVHLDTLGPYPALTNGLTCPNGFALPRVSLDVVRRIAADIDAENQRHRDRDTLRITDTTVDVIDYADGALIERCEPNEDATYSIGHGYWTWTAS